MESILISIKKMLGIEEDYNHFDYDIIMHINTALGVLNQIGVGPEECYSISSDENTWNDFLGEQIKNLNMVKTYVYLKVRLIFDPPTSSFIVDAFNKQITELESRMNTQVEYMKKEG